MFFVQIYMSFSPMKLLNDILQKPNCILNPADTSTYNFAHTHTQCHIGLLN